MMMRHRTSASSTRRAVRLNQRRPHAQQPSFRAQTERNELYAVIAQHSPQADLPSLLRLLG